MSCDTYELKALTRKGFTYMVTEKRNNLKGIRLNYYLPDVDARVKKRCFKYWSRIWPNQVDSKTGSISWSHTVGGVVHWRITYDGTKFYYDLFKRVLDQKGLKGEALIKALEVKQDLLDLLIERFTDKISFLWTTFRFLPYLDAKNSNSLATSLVQLKLFENDLDHIRNRHQPYDDKKLRRFLNSIEPMLLVLASND